MSISIAQLTAEIDLQSDGFKEGLRESAEAFTKFGREVRLAGLNFSALLTAPIVAAAGAAFGAGEQLDNAFDAIRISTGKTGAALEELKGNFRDVFGSVTQNAEEVGDTLGFLRNRSNLTGKALEELAKNELDLARITGSALKPQLESTTRLFGDWSVSSNKQSDALNTMLKVTQLTGGNITQLSERMVYFGAPLRELGYKFEDAAALMGKWRKEGVNVGLVAGSLRIGLKNMAKEGIEEPARAFPILIDMIKQAKTHAEQTTIAMKMFGARAGTDLVRAVLEGRFNIDQLSQSIANSGETIQKVAKDIDDFPEELKKMRNQIMLTVEPIETGLFQAFNHLMQQVKGPLLTTLKQLTDWFTHLKPSTQLAIAGTIAFAAAIGPAMLIVGQFAIAIGALLPVLGAVSAFLLGPWGIAIAGVSLAMWRMTGDGAKSLTQFKNNTMEFFAWMGPTFQQHWDAIVDIVKGAWDYAVNIVDIAWNAIKLVYQATIGILTEDSQTWADSIRDIFKTMWDDLVKIGKDGIGNLLNGFKNLGKSIYAAFTGGSKEAKNALQNQIASDTSDAVTGGWGNAMKSAQVKKALQDAMGELNVAQQNAMTARTTVQNPGNAGNSELVKDWMEWEQHVTAAKNKVASLTTELQQITGQQSSIFAKQALDVERSVRDTHAQILKQAAGIRSLYAELRKSPGNTVVERQIVDSSKHYNELAKSFRTAEAALQSLKERGGMSAKAAAQYLTDLNTVLARTTTEIHKQSDAEIRARIRKGVDGKGHKPKQTELERELKMWQQESAKLDAATTSLDSGSDNLAAKIMARYHELAKTAGGLKMVQEIIFKAQAKKLHEDQTHDLESWDQYVNSLKAKLTMLKTVSAEGLARMHAGKSGAVTDQMIKDAATLIEAEKRVRKEQEDATVATQRHEHELRSIKNATADYQAEYLKLMHLSKEDQVSLQLTHKLYKDITDAEEKKLVLGAVVAANSVDYAKDQIASQKQEEQQWKTITSAISDQHAKFLQLNEARLHGETLRANQARLFSTLSEGDKETERQAASLKILNLQYDDLDDALQAGVDAYLDWQHQTNAAEAANKAFALSIEQQNRVLESANKHLAEIAERTREVSGSKGKYSKFLTDLMNDVSTGAVEMTDDVLMMIDLIQEAEDKLSATERSAARAKQLVGEFKQEFNKLFMDIAQGGKNVFGTLLDDFTGMLQKMAAEYLTSQLLQALGGLIGGSFGAEFTKAAGGHWTGGSMAPGEVSMVGEHGPELWRAPSYGNVMSNEQLQTLAGSGGGHTSVNITVVANDAGSFVRTQNQIAEETGRAIDLARRRNG